MSQPTKYLTIVSSVLKLYQSQLLSLLKKSSLALSPSFTASFQSLFSQLQQTELHKSIDHPISADLNETHRFLDKNLRLLRTSQQKRQNLLSQGGKRMFRFTGGLKGEDTHQNQGNQMDEIIRSFKLDQQAEPRMRMKWKSPSNQRKIESNDYSTIGNNNIDLLSYAIPQLQHSIRRLSVRIPHSFKQKQADMMHRTLQSRSCKKKYIARLF